MTLKPFGRWPVSQFPNPIHSRWDSLDGGSACCKALDREASVIGNITTQAGEFVATCTMTHWGTGYGFLNIVTCISSTRQQLGKHKFKAGTAAEAEVNLLDNGTQTSVSAATNIIKGIPVTRNSNRGQLTVGHGDLHTGRVEVIKGKGSDEVNPVWRRGRIPPT
jgi:hypothetical protein